MKVNNICFKYFAMSFLLVFFLPLLPGVFQSSQVHVNFVIFCCCLIPLSLILKLDFKGLHFFIFFYYLVCQVLLIPSLISEIYRGDIAFSSIFSFLRPILLYSTYLSLLLLLERCSLQKIFSLIKIVVVVSFFYAILEVFFIEKFEDIIYFLYKREFRLNLTGISTTFFGTSYYSGFAFFTLFVLLISRFDVEENWYIYSVGGLTIILVLLSQSKTIIFSLFFSIVFLSAVSNRKFIRFLFYVFCLLFVITIINVNVIFESLSVYGLVIVKQLKVLIFSTSESATLNIRSEQIFYSLQLVNDNFGFFGEGLTPSNGSLESWPALFLYRYGIGGIFSFISLCIVVLIYSLSLMRTRNDNFAYIGKAGFVWSLTLPITQMSTPMLELSKTGFLTNFVFALITVAYARERKCTNTNTR